VSHGIQRSQHSGVWSLLKKETNAVIAKVNLVTCFLSSFFLNKFVIDSGDQSKQNVCNRESFARSQNMSGVTEKQRITETLKFTTNNVQCVKINKDIVGGQKGSPLASDTCGRKQATQTSRSSFLLSPFNF